MNEQDYSNIDAYLRDELTATERTRFEERVAAEPAFAAALAEQRKLWEHLAATATEPELRGTLETLGQRYFVEKPAGATVRPLRPRRRNWLTYAAAVALLLLAAGAFAFWPTGGNTYEQFAQHQPLALVERGTGDQLAGRAETAYNAADYVLAADLLQRYLNQQAGDERAKLALGVSLLETNQDSAAVRVFTEIVEAKSSLAPYGNWYLALAAVKRGDQAAALSFLDRIPATDTYLRERVIKLKATL
ncbi:MAG: hypothetical protein AAFN92_20180 [Bacteroidota bacterium]